MTATKSATYQSSAMAAGKDRAQGMPFSMSRMCMGMVAAISSITLIETGVMTAPVSFIALVLSLRLILAIVLLGSLISLALSGLTGLEVIDLVGLVTVTRLSRARKGA